MTEINLERTPEYRVNLDVFEGPLDLLLYLIKKNDLDIWDIPIAFVLEEYMRYIDTLKILDIDLAGEFLLMAAELAHIKSRMLLPDDGIPEEEEELDPRADLVRRLLEYQRYRDAAGRLASRTQLYRDVFVPLAPERVVGSDDGPIEVSVYDLIEAFGQVLKRMPEDQYHAVAVDRISVNARIFQLIDRIKKDVTLTLDDLLIPPIFRYDVVVTFLALLEMCRLKIVALSQVDRTGPIYLRGVMEEVHEEEMLRLVKTVDEGEADNGIT